MFVVNSGGEMRRYSQIGLTIEEPLNVIGEAI
jgi:hypothetical protein